MPDPSAFEQRLGEAFDRYVAAMPIAVDVDAVAALAMAGGSRGSRRRRSRPRLLMLVAVIALLSLIGAALGLIGSRRDDALPVQPDPTSASPETSLDSGYRPVGRMAHDSSVNGGTPIVVALRDGRVLIAGGADGVLRDATLGITPAQLLDPVTTTVVQIAPGINGIGSGVALDDGRALLIAHDRNATSSSAWLFDPATLVFTRVAVAAPANAPPFGVEPSLARLADGRVLIAGGRRDVYADDLLAGAMLFDPRTDTLVRTGAMATARWHHALVTLPDGRVVAAGGEASTPDPDAPDVPPIALDSIELYDPTTGTFSDAGHLASVRGAARAIVMPDGRVAITAAFLPEAELRSPSETGGVSGLEVVDPTGDLAPTFHELVRGDDVEIAADALAILEDGRILVTGGRRDGRAAGFGWSPLALKVDARGQVVDVVPPPNRHAGVATLANGRLLFAGGWPEGAEVFTTDGPTTEIVVLE